MRVVGTLVVAFGVSLLMAPGFGSGQVLAKGLDKLGEANPEEQAEGDDEDKGKKKAKKSDEEDESEAAEPAKPQSALSKMLAQKLFMGTSFGWVKGSRAEGTWTTSGMSDVTIGYKVVSLNSKMGVHGTFRYAPIAVSGSLDGKSYRGVWETYDFGGRFNYLVTPSINAIGSAELGYVMVHVRDTDGLAADDKAGRGGAGLTVGGGADFMISEKWAWSAGPRLFIGAGSFTTIQVAGAAGFLF